MKYSKINFEKLIGGQRMARQKISLARRLEAYFEEPIIHREIHGEKVYVPLNLHRVWNEV
ncbi:hypothetical protein PH210_17660 [Paenibacillus sp. BSR1-1]|uniref:hypothetical protein n=1 Tax=Paenibacillus sp. BSR1-1 TaxID=3020845 RepID=UPI0025B27011|nr:hypothetical protein [Paenibacillus sp. BSR1-1]MDN3018025.1 hypothetical protein [Paenibacillus sp. BSR1-1]